MKYYFTCLLLTIFLVGCNSDDGDTSAQYQNPNFSQVIIGELGENGCFGCDEVTYNFQLSFLDENFSVEESGRTNGRGPLLRLEFYSETDGLPSAGVYSTPPNDSSAVLAFRLQTGLYSTSAIDEFDPSTPYYVLDFANSQLEISYEGSQMIIEYNLNFTEDSGDFVENLNLSGRWDSNIRIIQNSLF